MDRDHRSLVLPHGRVAVPAFLPDATYGTVRTVDSQDLEGAGVQAVEMNVFHLMQRPGSTVIRSLGGLHRAFSWERPILTDSGGFQAYSLIRQNPRRGSITDRGIVFRPEGTARKVILTPEKSIQLQMSYGGDVVVCLDDCTHADAPYETQQEAVRRTILWARRCRETFDALMANRAEDGPRPLILGVIQGGNERDLRRQCAEALLEIGFDGYGLGGWPLDSAGNLLTDIIGFIRELVPAEYPMHALGVGHPDHVLTCARMGYTTFDSSLPTRDARRGRLAIMKAEGDAQVPLGTDWWQYLYIQDERHRRDGRPLSESCDCHTCRHYSRAYLHHLFRVEDGLYDRLATIHNLRFMTRLMARIRAEGGPHGG
ncbi:MAG TPA: tRNA guanosine(34) transglycosylase Tgt [Chloroflexi bacterium]|jgi:queuine tRNA-ribosyltransferase|nr:tRNA guanosine(34) transglycosylase Tgt [Chloroflexota bacterium]